MAPRPSAPPQLRPHVDRAPEPGSIGCSPTHGGHSKLLTHDLHRHLESMFGPGATFRDGQSEAIDAVIDDGSRALVVQRTGWGKSAVYWIATRVRRDAGHGPTLIISPLL